ALLSTDLSTVPGGATSWSSSDDMKTWTFNIDPDLTWSDGVPLTAHDYVYTWQYYADPEHAYDFTWYFGMLEVENYGAIEAGEKALDALGVTATDDKTLVFQLDTPAPYVPGFMMYGSPLAKHAAEKHGQYYSNDPS
ncbi:TPA: peptide ABC transporter substrate-binding protein, partial [Candidatus Poribacteria bacterium]|nr:peptide ABC transporter substrate-binding protein [Candidatus Poribacteria bacterium]